MHDEGRRSSRGTSTRLAGKNEEIPHQQQIAAIQLKILQGRSAFSIDTRKSCFQQFCWSKFHVQHAHGRATSCKQLTPSKQAIWRFQQLSLSLYKFLLQATILWFILLRKLVKRMSCCPSHHSNGGGNGGTPCNKCLEDSSVKSFYCTACAKQCFSAKEVREHPYLKGVGICSDCYTFLFSGPFTIDKNDGCEEQCRWCGQGGKIVVCSQCNKVFCEACIVRNYGCLHGLALILHNKKWSCFLCCPVLVGVHVKEFKNFRKSITGDVDGADGVNEGIDPQNVAALFKFFLNQKQEERRTTDKKRGRPKLKVIQQVMKPTRKKKETVVVGSRKSGRQSTKLKGQKSVEKQEAVCATSPSAHFRPHQVKLKLKGEENRVQKRRKPRMTVEERKRLKSGNITNDPILQQKGDASHSVKEVVFTEIANVQVVGKRR